MEWIIGAIIGYIIGRYTFILRLDTALAMLDTKLTLLREIADEGQRNGDKIAMGNALLRIRRIVDGVE